MVAGSSVQGAISASEARAHAVGHVIGRREINGRTHGMGASLKGAKIWETESCESLLEFRDWCDELGVQMGNPGAGGVARIPHLEQLALHKRLERFPDVPIAAILDARLLQGGTELHIGATAHDLAQLDLIAVRESDQEIRLELQSEAQVLWAGHQNARGEITPPAGDEPYVRFVAGIEAPVSEVLEETEPFIYFADGKSTQGGFIFESASELAPPPDDTFGEWNWDGCDITRETTQPPDGRRNVQDQTVESVKQEFDNPIVIVDHNSGEIADVVALERYGAGQGERVRAHFLHCKGSSEAAPGIRVADLYDVVGQTVRSARWSHPGALFAELDRRWHERNSISVESNHTRDEVTAILRAWTQQPVEAELFVWSVQPGLSRGRMGAWQNGNTLLAAAAGWCSSEGATFRVACSA
jgi:hypothetical protein